MALYMAVVGEKGGAPRAESAATVDVFPAKSAAAAARYAGRRMLGAEFACVESFWLSARTWRERGPGYEGHIAAKRWRAVVVGKDGRRIEVGIESGVLATADLAECMRRYPRRPVELLGKAGCGARWTA